MSFHVTHVGASVLMCVLEHALCPCLQGLLLRSNGYSLVGLDLQSVQSLSPLLPHCRVDPTLPTLVLSECVLTYIKPERCVWTIVFVCICVRLDVECVNMGCSLAQPDRYATALWLRNTLAHKTMSTLGMLNVMSTDQFVFGFFYNPTPTHTHTCTSSHTPTYTPVHPPTPRTLLPPAPPRSSAGPQAPFLLLCSSPMSRYLPSSTGLGTQC